MKQCLQCDKEFESKRDAGKFCSDKCRVKWHRKNPKKEQVQKFQMQVLYNEMVEILSEIKASLPTPQIYDCPPLPKSYFKDEPKQYQEPKIKVRRSFENYAALRKDCDSEEEWIELKEEILNSDLSEKQKALLTN